MPARPDPLHRFRFLVEIDGVVKGSFAEVSGLVSETEVIEYRTGGEATVVRKLPGLTKYANIVLKRGLTTDRSLWEWRLSVVEGQTERRNGSITLLDEAGNAVLRFLFVNAWPCKWMGPELDASGSEVAIETVELAHEGFELEV